MYFPFIKYRRIFYLISAILVVLSLASIFVFGLKGSIDFSGGSSLEVLFKNEPPSFEEIRKSLEGLDLGEISFQKTGERGITLRTKEVSEELHQQILERLKSLGEIEEGSESFQNIGSLIGREMKNKTKVVIFLSLAGLLIYVAVSFRKLSRTVKSYIYGFTAIIALCHDIIIPLGVLAVLGRLKGVEITIPIITAFLTVFGYSINDTVVVYDRIRENVLKRKTSDFGMVIEQSINQTLTRSINTVLTVLISLLAIFFFGGETLRYFSLSLIIGISCGCYSSIFIAAPLVFTYYKFREKRQKKNRQE